MSKKRIWLRDNEWCTVTWKRQREECCKCGARHEIDYRVVADEYLPGRALKVKGKLQFRARLVGRKKS